MLSSFMLVIKFHKSNAPRLCTACYCFSLAEEYIASIKPHALTACFIYILSTSILYERNLKKLFL